MEIFLQFECPRRKEIMLLYYIFLMFSVFYMDWIKGIKRDKTKIWQKLKMLTNWLSDYNFRFYYLI